MEKIPVSFSKFFGSLNDNILSATNKMCTEYLRLMIDKQKGNNFLDMHISTWISRRV